MDVLLRVFDKKTPTHALREKHIPPGEVWQYDGYLFAANDVANLLGEPDDTVVLGECPFPAWRLKR